VIVRYWGGAKRAAGTASESIDAATIGELKAQLARRPALSAVSATAGYLVDGLAAGDDAALSDGAVVDVLPPFAGGSSG
jgi:molybdopterin converting factor small subunit